MQELCILEGLNVGTTKTLAILNHACLSLDEVYLRRGLSGSVYVKPNTTLQLPPRGSTTHLDTPRLSAYQDGFTLHIQQAAEQTSYLSR
jgi:hypothetical protein